MLSNAHDAMPSVMHVIKYMRMQVRSIATPDGAAASAGPFGGGRPPSAPVYTAVLSTQPENSTSVQLLMDADAPQDAPILEASKEASGALTIAVCDADGARVAHAIVPLEQVWQARVPVPRLWPRDVMAQRAWSRCP